jgi:hypothetical protein
MSTCDKGKSYMSIACVIVFILSQVGFLSAYVLYRKYQRERMDHLNTKMELLSSKMDCAASRLGRAAQRMGVPNG